jgi:predicted Zn-dependent protease
LFQVIAFAVLFTAIYLTSTFAQGVYIAHGKISNGRVYEIYRKIIASTGQAQDALPLMIIDLPIVNAYNDGREVVIYRGLLNYIHNEDELAYILGHEVSHSMLRHVYFKDFQRSTLEIAESEANADKMGAFYMMKAGFNICVAREIWMRMKNDGGNYQGADHPDYSYRYDEISIGCSK